MSTMFKRRQAPLHFAHFTFLKLTAMEWLALIFVVLAVTVER